MIQNKANSTLSRDTCQIGQEGDYHITFHTRLVDCLILPSYKSAFNRLYLLAFPKTRSRESIVVICKDFSVILICDRFGRYPDLWLSITFVLLISKVFTH